MERKAVEAVTREGEALSQNRLEALMDVKASAKAKRAGMEQAAARGTLRSARYRLSRPNEAGQFIGERGFTREAGSLLFHWSLLLLIAGAVVSQGFGFRGQAIIVEGDRWAETSGNYSFYHPGRFYPDSWHKGFVLELES